MPDWAKEAPAGIQTQKRLENNIIINIIGIFFVILMQGKILEQNFSEFFLMIA